MYTMMSEDFVKNHVAKTRDGRMVGVVVGSRER